MYGQSCRGEGRGGVGPLRFGGASLCGRGCVTFGSPPLRGDPPGPLGSLGKQYIALAACPGTCVPTCPRGGGRQARPPWCMCRGLGCVGGGVVGGKEGVGAGHHPVASRCVVVGGGEGVVLIVHEGNVPGGGWGRLPGRGA